MFYIAQAGSSIQIIQTDGTIYKTLTLPSGVTIATSRIGRFAVLNQQIVLVNSPTKSLWIDPSDFTVRPMVPLPPSAAVTLAAGSGTGLSGVYRVKVSFVVKDENGVTMTETRLGPASGPVTLSNTSLDITDIPKSSDSTVNCRRIYRTVAGGAVYFQMMDLDDNETTEIRGLTLADSALELLPSDPKLGNPPGSIPGTRMELVTEWRNRLWGKGTDDPDEIRFTDLNKFYAWNAFLLAQPKGEDSTGIVGFLRRRDELVVGKRRRLLKVTGTDEDSFDVQQIAEGVGLMAPDGGCVVRDIAYFLGTDGTVYSYGPNGVAAISNDRVDPWFKSDTYFNRSLFDQTVASYNPITDAVEFQLAAAGSSNLDRWVAYDIRRKEWYGPHLTGKFTPTVRALLADADGNAVPVIGGSDAYIYTQNQSGASDNGTAIAISWQTKAFNADAPHAEKFWGKPVFHVKNQGATAGPITVTPRVGRVDQADDEDPLSVPQNGDTGEVDRPSHEPGEVLQLTFTHSTDAEDVDLRGFELPYAIIGNRKR